MSESLARLLTETLASGSWLVYAILFLSGVVTSFTPCTYPVLPLTVGAIGGLSRGSRLRGFSLSVALVLGMAFVYAVVGTVFAALGMQFGALWGSGWVVYLIALFFILMSLFLLDVFSFPTFGVFEGLRSRVDARKSGWLGMLLVGGVSALIVGPCTGPILAVILGYITLSLSSSTGFAFWAQVLNSGFQFFLFGLGQGTLIVLCGTFAGFLAVLPGSGAWLVQVKKAFALMILLASTLLLVYVGQGTDFPDLISLLASLEAPTAFQEEETSRSQISEFEISEENISEEAVLGEELLEEGVSDAEISETEEPSEPALAFPPDFTLKVLGGENFRLSQMRGNKAVVLIFFATWCPACMAEVPEINKFAELVKDDDILVFGVNFRQTESVLRQFQTRREVKYSILLDADGSVASAYGVTGIPHIVGVSRKGVPIYRGIHLPPDRKAFIESLLTE